MAGSRAKQTVDLLVVESADGKADARDTETVGLMAGEKVDEKAVCLVVY